MLIILGIGTVLLVAGAAFRHWKVAPLRFEDFVAIVLVSYGLAIAIGGALLPALWLGVSYALYHGRVEDNLLPGSNLETLLIGSIIAAMIGLGWAFRSYRANVLKVDSVLPASSKTPREAAGETNNGQGETEAARS